MKKNHHTLKIFVNSCSQQGTNEVLKADRPSHMSVFVQHSARWLPRRLISLQAVPFALFAVHRLCGLGACDSAGGASEISRGLAQTVQLRVSRATSENHQQLLALRENVSLSRCTRWQSCARSYHMVAVECHHRH